MKITVELDLEELNRMVGLAFDAEHAMVQHSWKTRHIAIGKLAEVTDYLNDLAPNSEVRYMR